MDATGMMLQVPCKPWPLQIECHQFFFSCRAVYVLRCGILSNIGLVMMLWRWVVILYGVFRRVGRYIQSNYFRVLQSYSSNSEQSTYHPVTLPPAETSVFKRDRGGRLTSYWLAIILGCEKDPKPGCKGSSDLPHHRSRAGIPEFLRNSPRSLNDRPGRVEPIFEWFALLES